MTSATSEHVDSAKAAGLRYVTDAMPGITRKRSGKGFSYVAPDGSTVREREAIQRFRSLVIPPAWTNVWICPIENGHLQVTARDARGRKQYRYHPKFREQRDGTKFERMFEFGDVIWKIRDAVERDIKRDGLPRVKVLATLVWLLERTFIRVGTEEMSRMNKSYGLTTLRKKHVNVAGSELRFEFRGKSGVEHAVTVDDERIARIVQRCHDLRGEVLFKYLDDDGARREVEAADVNDYLATITGGEITAKDFRTWAGTMIAAEYLRALGPAPTLKQANRNIVAAIDHTSERLGNTRAVCRKYYIHPALIDAYLKGDVLPPRRRSRQQVRKPGGKLRRHEAEVLAFLRERQRSTTGTGKTASSATTKT
jgi:DNA topoisomerase-1